MMTYTTDLQRLSTFDDFSPWFIRRRTLLAWLTGTPRIPYVPRFEGPAWDKAQARQEQLTVRKVLGQVRAIFPDTITESAGLAELGDVHVSELLMGDQWFPFDPYRAWRPAKASQVAAHGLAYVLDSYVNVGDEPAGAMAHAAPLAYLAQIFNILLLHVDRI